jgi:polyhydroxybutyrate depolymerase
VRKLLVVIAGLGLVAGACSSDGGSESAPDRTSTTTAATDPASVPAAPSAGCDTSTVGAGETKQTATFEGQERWWLRRVPPAHDGRTPVPLVLDLHGYSEGATIHASLSEVGPFGDEKGFVTLTPHGEGAVARWDTALGSKDLEFLGEVLDTTEQDLCIDTNRVYSTGLSNGAFMTSAIACEYSDRFAAVAPVAGVRAIEGCDATRPVPVVAFHGTDDGFVTYDGGFGEKALDLPAPDGSGRTVRDTVSEEQIDDAADPESAVPAIMQRWAKRNGCATGDEEAEVAADVTRITYDCPAGAATVLYRITGGGHSWPGSAPSLGLVGILGKTTMNISANELMWEFFQDHPLPAANSSRG